MPASSDDSVPVRQVPTRTSRRRCGRRWSKKKQGGAKGLHGDNPLREKAHGSEVAGGAAPKMHRRKAGGGGPEKPSLGPARG